MIRLENIEKKNDIISATVTTIENNPIQFEIAVNVKNRTIIKNSLGKMNMDVSMAIGKLVRLADESSTLPKVAETIYY